MRLFNLAILLSLVAFLASCEPATDDSTPVTRSSYTADMTLPDPPVAKIDPTSLEMHGDVRTDDYFWIRERENQEVIDYLEAENAYTDAAMAPTQELQDALFEEIVGRIKQDDSSVPYKDGKYWYYTRYEEGSEYPIFCRKAGSLDAREEIMLNANELAEGHEFFSVRGTSVSSNDDILAYSQDTVGRRFYTVRFKNLTTGAILQDMI